jgi:hypothetical protein
MRKKKVKAVLYLYMGLFAEMGLRGKEAAVSEESKTQVHNSTANLGHPVDFPADVSARDFLELAEKLG